MPKPEDDDDDNGGNDHTGTPLVTPIPAVETGVAPVPVKEAAPEPEPVSEKPGPATDKPETAPKFNVTHYDK